MTTKLGGKNFIVGDEIFANSNSEYAGLFGTVREILTESGGETDNKKPEICCTFLPPESDRFIAALEEQASAFYALPLCLEDIGMDDIVMSPEKLELIAPSVPSAKEAAYTLFCCADRECNMVSGTLGISSDKSILFRRMLDDLKSHDVNLVLSHYRETRNGFVFIYEGLDVERDDTYLCYTIASTPIYPPVQGGVGA